MTKRSSITIEITPEEADKAKALGLSRAAFAANAFRAALELAWQRMSIPIPAPSGVQAHGNATQVGLPPTPVQGVAKPYVPKPPRDFSIRMSKGRFRTTGPLYTIFSIEDTCAVLNLDRAKVFQRLTPEEDVLVVDGLEFFSDFGVGEAIAAASFETGYDTALGSDLLKWAGRQSQ